MPDTTPLRMGGLIVSDGPQRRLDAARDQYRRSCNRGYSLSERGYWQEAQSVLDKANAALRRAEEEYEASRRGSA